MLCDLSKIVSTILILPFGIKELLCCIEKLQTHTYNFDVVGGFERMTGAGARIATVVLTLGASLLSCGYAARASHELHTESIRSGEELSHTHGNNSMSTSALREAGKHPSYAVGVAPQFDGLNVLETIIAM
ncbi:hypothetical protein O6H91_10G062600 [Diphasiastrum complanatum]|uniref:Uncharacterized protein n=1 Tax=Diphasiastrum complanatum TaxID=34168 RepID=A0ACC2CHI1_DIPCM|nr:hypothetical protein O6H91_10G062600 [Diphasiastrum complanatum]